MGAEPTIPANAILQLTAADVTVVLDVSDGQLPAIIHWGKEVVGLDAESARSLVRASVPTIGSNNVALPPRPSLLPGHHTGWTGRPGVSGSFDGVGWSPRFIVDSIALDGAVVEGFTSTGSASVLFHATDASSGLELSLIFELLPSGLIRARASLSNRSSALYTVDDVTISFPVAAEAAELLDFTGEHNYERIPQRMPWRSGLHMRENRRGRTAADSAFLLHAGTQGFDFASGDIWAVHAAWSGNHRHVAERVFTGEQLLGGGEVLLPGEIRLSIGEHYETPWVYGSYGVGLDAVAHRFHHHLRARDRAVDYSRPVTLNVWEAVYFHQDLGTLTDLADLAATIGIDRYVLDDGWFGGRRDDLAGLGDWVVASDIWPEGLHPLIDHVRGLGIQFGLWFEPEMINLDSDLARAHPEWVMSAGENLPVESRNQHVLDISNTQAYQHVRNQIFAVLDEYPIDYIKWDHNRDLIDAGSQLNEGRPAVHAQTLSFYQLLDEIRERYPHLEIESCSSGGARVDLGVLERTDRVWVSDNIDPHDRQHMLRWTSQLVPPEYMGSHIASGRSHTTGRMHDLSFRAGTAIFGHLGVEWDLTTATSDEIAELTEWIAFYKHNRRLLLTGDMVRIDSTDDHILIHGVVSQDKLAALFAVAVLDTVYPDPPARFKTRGLKPKTRYHVQPIFVGPTPSGLFAPPWWGTPTAPGEPVDAEHLRRYPRKGVRYPGDTFDSDALETIGVASPRIHPDQVLIYRILQAD